MTPPEKIIKKFVPRQNTFDDFQTFLAQNKARVGVLEGSYGMGKTSAAARLYRRNNTGHSWMWADLANFENPLLDYTHIANKERLVMALQMCRDCINTLSADLLLEEEQASFDSVLTKMIQIKDVNEPFSAVLKNLGKAVVGAIEVKLPSAQISGDKLVAALSSTTDEQSSPNVFAQNFLETTNRMVKELTRRIKSVADQKQVVIFLDNYCYVHGTFFGSWVTEQLLPELKPYSKFVFIHTPILSLQDALPDETVMPIRLEEFSVDETRYYLEKRLGKAIGEVWYQHVYDYCHGHPYLTELYTDLVEKNPNVSPAKSNLLQDLVMDTSKDITRRLEELINVWGKEFRKQDEAASIVVDAACVLGEFDQELLQKVLDNAIPRPQFQEIWSRLKQSFMEEIEKRRFAVNDVFGPIRKAWLENNTPDFVGKIHSLAAEHYGELLHKHEEDDTSGIWARMHRYESLAWQRDLQRWLYHIAGQPIAGVEIATRYFDAFFWWGEYVPFPFCDLILAAAQHTALPKKSARVLDLLEQFHQKFVPIRQRKCDQIPPISLVGVLENLLDELNLQDIRDTSPDIGRRWHLRGTIQNYLGEVYAQNDPCSPEAEDAYLDGIRSFTKAEEVYAQRLSQINDPQDKNYKFFVTEKDSNTWYRSWTTIWLAGLYVERGDLENALVLGNQAYTTMWEVDKHDIEILARAHCIRGDVFFQRHLVDEAFIEYSWYALYAYGFLTECDFYADGFYREMVERLAKRFSELESDLEQYAWFWNSFLHFWRPAEVGLPVGSDTPVPFSAAIQLDDSERAVSHHLPLPWFDFPTDPQKTISPDVLALVSNNYHTLLSKYRRSRKPTHIVTTQQFSKGLSETDCSKRLLDQEIALNKAKRALAILENQAAGYTSLTIPVNLQIELEDKRKEVAYLENATSSPEKPSP